MAAENINKSKFKTNTSTRKSTLTLVTLPSFSISGEISAEKMGVENCIPPVIQFQFSTHIFSADISPEMLKLGRVTKVKVFLLVLVFVLNFDLFIFSTAILEKGL